MALEITWLPFELHPDTAPEGVNLTDLFNMSAESLEQMHLGLKQRAAEVGLPMEPSPTLFNTRRAHLLAEYADDLGSADHVRRRLFRVNFVEGRNLSDADVLKEVAEGAGLNAGDALAAINDPKYEERINASMAQAQQFGVTGVPAFIVEDHYKIVGALPYEQLLATFRQIQHENP